MRFYATMSRTQTPVPISCTSAGFLLCLLVFRDSSIKHNQSNDFFVVVDHISHENLDMELDFGIKLIAGVCIDA